MNKVTLQVPMSRDMKIAAQEKAMAMGFSSLQEAVRIFLGKLSAGLIDISIEEKEVKLSKKAIKRYEKMEEDRKRGVNWHKAENIDDLLNQLNS